REGPGGLALRTSASAPRVPDGYAFPAQTIPVEFRRPGTSSAQEASLPCRFEPASEVGTGCGAEAPPRWSSLPSNQRRPTRGVHPTGLCTGASLEERTPLDTHEIRLDRLWVGGLAGPSRSERWVTTHDKHLGRSLRSGPSTTRSRRAGGSRLRASPSLPGLSRSSFRGVVYRSTARGSFELSPRLRGRSRGRHSLAKRARGYAPRDRFLDVQREAGSTLARDGAGAASRGQVDHRLTLPLLAHRTGRSPPL